MLVTYFNPVSISWRYYTFHEIFSLKFQKKIQDNPKLENSSKKFHFDQTFHIQFLFEKVTFFETECILLRNWRFLDLKRLWYTSWRNFCQFKDIQHMLQSKFGTFTARKIFGRYVFGPKNFGLFHCNIIFLNIRFI